MMQKIRGFPIAAFLALSGFTRKLKKDERGLSGVVVAILLILVAVLAIVLIWTFLGDWLNDLWDRIISGSDKVK